MAIHLTPTELAHELGIQRSDVIASCVEHGIPVFQGKVDKTLFEAEIRRAEPLHRAAASAAGSAA